MAQTHPLDRVAASALAGRQAHLALVQGASCRFDPAYAVFAAVADHTDASLADLATLVARYGDVAFLSAEPPPAAPGLAIVSREAGVQMIAERLGPPTAGPDLDIVPLTDDDAPEMLALATLTQPGPFFERTHQLGDFFGVRRDGRLAAMAGERMKPEGHTEVSGVCTHPDQRGQGLAAALTRHVAARILARGETPFLHAYASNRPAIAVYEALGFTLRRTVLMTRFTRAG